MSVASSVPGGNTGFVWGNGAPDRRYTAIVGMAGKQGAETSTAGGKIPAMRLANRSGKGSRDCAGGERRDGDDNPKPEHL